jgi:hypothetical protein
METKPWQKVVKIVVIVLLILANLWVWAGALRGCATRTQDQDQTPPGKHADLGNLHVSTECIYFLTPY